ncbi:hypothetical protein JOF56_011116 [Kibdelosporangium banguiense]|uniref:Sporulation and spore germination n=1 Tax=Kibdelosporangium banguiense TaxID=1365924 RepID=A0ABS4U3H1_9PSEU|nr:hypothetical protein [Kibdelosporangium banguiense]MBP2330731.1 hypothetical protein [Kibdelosporangium banguiense]
MKRLLLALLVLLAGCGVQPTDPITGNPSTGAMVYLIQLGSPTPVLRPTPFQARPNDSLSLLADSLTAAERDAGFTNEVPNTASPITIAGSTITLQVDPNSLSALAVAQIACTAAVSRPVTLTGGGQTRGPTRCPV